MRDGDGNGIFSILHENQGPEDRAGISNPMEKFITANNTALRVADTQKGSPAIVLLHGYLESLDIWDDFTTLLAPQYRVVAIDLPGHGISTVHGEVHTMEFLADVLKGVLDRVGIERCFVAGHSMGGYVAQAFSEKYPEVLEGLILFHSSPNPDSEEKKENRWREIELIRQDKKELLATLFAPKGFAPENRRRLGGKIREMEEQIAMTDDEGIVALLRGMMERKDMNGMLHGLKAPQLFIFGRGDEFIPVEVAETIIAAQPQAEIAWLEHSGHMGFLEEPETAASILRAFMDKHRDNV